MSQCTARAFVFSGRPDPTWPVAKQQAHRLEIVWSQLPTSAASHHPSPALGYRGVSLTCVGNKEYFALDGYVKRTIGYTTEWKKDSKRLFERLLLGSAPNGLLPIEIIET